MATTVRFAVTQMNFERGPAEPCDTEPASAGVILNEVNLQDPEPVPCPFSTNEKLRRWIGVILFRRCVPAMRADGVVK
jgi:hypothetical protein